MLVHLLIIITVHDDGPFQHKGQITICYFHSSMDFGQKLNLDRIVNVVFLRLEYYADYLHFDDYNQLLLVADYDELMKMHSENKILDTIRNNTKKYAMY